MRRVSCWMLCAAAVLLMIPAALWAVDVWLWTVLDRPFPAVWVHDDRSAAAAALFALGGLCAIVAGLVACGSASDDPAQRVEKPVTVETQR